MGKSVYMVIKLYKKNLKNGKGYGLWGDLPKKTFSKYNFRYKNGNKIKCKLFFISSRKYDIKNK